jgi:hypothetical protein
MFLNNLLCKKTSLLHDTFLIISDDKGLYFLKTCQNMDFFQNEKLMYVALDAIYKNTIIITYCVYVIKLKTLWNFVEAWFIFFLFKRYAY